jgi:hypothetical protein
MSESIESIMSIDDSDRWRAANAVSAPGFVAYLTGYMSERMNPWKKIYNDFKALLDEEDRIVRQRVPQELSYAYVTNAESGEVDCWVQSMPTEVLLAGFELVAAEAGRALGAPPGTPAQKFWLHHIFLDLRTNNSDHIHIYSNTVGTIERLLEASAIYCLRLDRQALDGAVIPSESAADFIATPLPEAGIPSRGKRGPKPSYENALRVAEVVARVAGNSKWFSRLDEICLELDEQAIPRPKTWKKRGHVDWFDALSERPLVVKAIAHHLKLAAIHRRTFS